VNTTHGLRRALQINPNGLATVFGKRRRNWREVGERVARLAAGLRALGADLGDRVAILSLNSDRYLELYLATAWAGAVIVPLNIRWSPLENEDALRDCRANVLAVDKAFAATGAELAKALPSLKLVYADDGDAPAGMASYETLLTRSEPIPDAMRTSSDLAGIFYTGGTTGRSKGVMLSHGNLMANALNALGEGLFPSTSIYLHAAPMFHLANGAAMYSLLLSGGANVMIQAFTPEGVMAAVQNERATDVLLVPTMIQMLVDHPALSSHDMSSLRNLVYGASPISEAVLDRATKALPNAQFTQAYGMTELSPIATLLHWKEHIGEARAKGRHRAAGRATLGCEVRIVDTDDKPVAFGTVGEIVVRGDNVMMGYWERPEETARRDRRLGAHRRRRLHGRKRLRLRRRPRQGHDHFGRRERVFGRGRERHLPASGRGPMRRRRHPGRALGRTGPRRGRAQGRRQGLAHRADRVLQDADRRVQVSTQRRSQGKPVAALGRRQGAQARTAQAVLGKPGAARELGRPVTRPHS
jgi:long-chain acyl-CoA synthetase